jgi:hypothetical protein
MIRYSVVKDRDEGMILVLLPEQDMILSGQVMAHRGVVAEGRLILLVDLEEMTSFKVDWLGSGGECTSTN